MSESLWTRRDMLLKGGSTLAVLAFFDSPLFAQVWGAREGERVLSFLDPPPPPPPNMAEVTRLEWEKLDSYITPAEQFFNVGHYNKPAIDAKDWKLELAGLVERPRTFTLEEIEARPRKEIVFTLECSGNNGFEWFTGGIGTARWAGTPLAPILQEAGIQDDGIEVVFFGTDEGEEEVRGVKMTENFARSMSVEDAMSPDNILCYEMNGEPLPQLHGYPLRLIAPEWYGIANVKWIKRIEILPTRWAGRFMAKDYVTLREEPLPNGESVWTQKVVGRARIKSATAKVTEKDGRYRIYGAAWGAPIARVEVRIDEGPWQQAIIDQGQEYEYGWKLWHLDWSDPAAGEHSITSRAVDTQGNIQPTPDDPMLANKHTYWESNGQITRRIRIG